MKNYILSILLALNVFNVKSQTCTLYTTGDYISSSLINDLYQDSEGFIWATTEYGLNSFDGNKFTVFTHSDADSTSICNSYSRVVFEDSRKNFFVGTLTGLTLFNKEENNFRNIPLYINKIIINPHISSITETAGNEIWVSTSNRGIFKLDKNHGRGTCISSIYNAGLKNINTLLSNRKGNLWIGSIGKGVFVYNIQHDKLKKIENAELRNSNVTSLAISKSGNIYIGTFTNGLFVYKEKTGKVEKICDGTNLQIKSLKFIDDRLHICTDGNGLKVYDKHTKKIHDLYTDNNPVNLKNAKVHTILQDSKGNLWLGIFQKGIIFINNSTGAFKSYGGKGADKSQLGEGCVMSIYKDKEGKTLVGIDSKGLYLLDSQYKVMKHYEPRDTENGLPGAVLSIFKDSEQHIWLGSYSHGICKFDLNTGICEPIPALKNENVFSITEDHYKNLYISTYGSGLYLYNLKTGKLTSYTSHHNPDCLPDNWINSLFCDSEGYIWIGHFKGVTCFNPKTKSFVNFTDNNYILKDKMCYSITEDKTKTIWIGTSEGLFSFNKQTGETKKYDTGNGIPADVICSITEDNNGNIWFSTFNGLCKFNKSHNTFTSYYQDDGLQGNEFTRGAFFKSEEGELLFGGTNGITCFYPDHLSNSIPKPELKITDFEIAGKNINTTTKSHGIQIIDKEITKARRFHLSHYDNTFRIMFTTMNFGGTSHIKYKYRIKELDNKWLATRKGENYITFNNLPSGKYTLEVYAINRNINSDIYTYEINIAYPWYQTWWAYILFSIPFIILILLIINFIREKIRRKKELIAIQHAREINEAKLQFFINISHEIRTPMTLIINPLEKLISHNTDKETGKAYMMIYRNAQRILRLINQLMDIRKIEKGQMEMKFKETDMVEFINDLMMTFDNATKQKNIQFNFFHEAVKEKAWIDINNFDKVLMNLLSNAFKYTPDNGSISVYLSSGINPEAKEPLKKFIKIQVVDSGIGLDENKKDHIFERFYQISGNGIHNQGGTGVGLHLTRSLVEMHYGMITADNNKDAQGSTFTVIIPQGRKHLRPEQIDESQEEYIPNNTMELIDIPEKTSEEKPVSKERSKTNFTIIIVDDEKEIQEYLKNELSDEFKIITANNGSEAYEYILKNKVDLIVSDVMMDVMDGFTLCKKIKQNINTNHLPVILLTAKGKAEEQIEGIELGADAYIVKPFNTDVLRSTISGLLHNRSILKNKFSGSQDQKEKIQKIKIKSSDEVLMEKIMNAINKNIADPSFNVEMLAQEVGLSRVHLHRKLKELTNFSTRDFIRNIRMQQAARLFKEKKLSISEVAYAVGFDNLSHFSNTFKETYGVSPTEFVNNNLEKME